MHGKNMKTNYGVYETPSLDLILRDWSLFRIDKFYRLKNYSNIIFPFVTESLKWS